MRLVAGLFALVLSSSLAVADEAKPLEPLPEAAPLAAPTRQKANLRVVKILPESNQALILDKNRGTHVLVEVGSAIGGYTVDAIEDDEVTLVAGGKELVLAAPAHRGGSRSLREEKAPKAGSSTGELADDPYAPASNAPADPYAKDAPVDPYAEPKVREVTAPTPFVAGDGGVRVANPHGVDMAPVDGDPYSDDFGTDEDSIRATAPMIPSSPTTTAPSGAAPSTTAPSTTAPSMIPSSPTTTAPSTTAPSTTAPIVDSGKPPASTAPRSTPAGLEPGFAPTGPASPKTLANAPTDPYAGPTTASKADATDPYDANDPTEAPADPYGDEPAPAPIAPTVLSGRELRQALANFDSLTTMVRGTFVADGARLDAVQEGSIFAKAGLRAGDIVTAVDNTPLTSLDAAADLYARASTTRAANISVLRKGKPLAMRVLFN